MGVVVFAGLVVAAARVRSSPRPPSFRAEWRSEARRGGSRSVDTAAIPVISRRPSVRSRPLGRWGPCCWATRGSPGPTRIRRGGRGLQGAEGGRPRDGSLSAVPRPASRSRSEAGAVAARKLRGGASPGRHVRL